MEARPRPPTEGSVPAQTEGPPAQAVARWQLAAPSNRRSTVPPLLLGWQLFALGGSPGQLHGTSAYPHADLPARPGDSGASHGSAQIEDRRQRPRSLAEAVTWPSSAK